MSTVVRVPNLLELPQQANLRGYWKFDGDLLDETATNTDFVDGDAYVAGYLSPKLRGAMIGGSAEVGNQVSYQQNAVDATLRINGNVTVMCAFAGQRSFNPTGTTSQVVLAEVANGAAGQIRYSLAWRDEGKMRYVISNGSGGTNSLETTTRTNNGESHVMALRKSGTTAEIYLDGRFVQSGTLGAATGDGTGTVLKCGRLVNNDQSIAIAGLGIWDTALTAAEIADATDKYMSLRNLIDEDPGADTFDVDFSEAQDVFTRASTGNFIVTASNPQPGRVMMLDLDNTGGAGTLTLPSGTVTISGTYTGGDRNVVMLLCFKESPVEYFARIFQP